MSTSRDSTRPTGTDGYNDAGAAKHGETVSLHFSMRCRPCCYRRFYGYLLDATIYNRLWFKRGVSGGHVALEPQHELLLGDLARR